MKEIKQENGTTIFKLENGLTVEFSLSEKWNMQMAIKEDISAMPIADKCRHSAIAHLIEHTRSPVNITDSNELDDIKPRNSKCGVTPDVKNIEITHEYYDLPTFSENNLSDYLNRFKRYFTGPFEAPSIDIEKERIKEEFSIGNSSLKNRPTKPEDFALFEKNMKGYGISGVSFGQWFELNTNYEDITRADLEGHMNSLYKPANMTLRVSAPCSIESFREALKHTKFEEIPQSYPDKEKPFSRPYTLREPDKFPDFSSKGIADFQISFQPSTKEEALYAQNVLAKKLFRTVRDDPVMYWMNFGEMIDKKDGTVKIKGSITAPKMDVIQKKWADTLSKMSSSKNPDETERKLAQKILATGKFQINGQEKPLISAPQISSQSKTAPSNLLALNAKKGEHTS